MLDQMVPEDVRMQSFNQFQGANYIGVQYESVQYGWLGNILPIGLVIRMVTPILRRITMVLPL